MVLIIGISNDLVVNILSLESLMSFKIDESSTDSENLVWNSSERQGPTFWISVFSENKWQ